LPSQTQRGIQAALSSFLLDTVRLRPVIVHQAGQVKKGLDTVQIGADSLETPLPPDAGFCTEVARKVVAIHLLTMVAGSETGGILGPGQGGGY